MLAGRDFHFHSVVAGRLEDPPAGSNYGKKVKVPLSQHRTEPGTPATSTLEQGSRWQLIGSFHTCGPWQYSQNIEIIHQIKLSYFRIHILDSVDLEYLLDSQLVLNFPGFGP